MNKLTASDVEELWKHNIHNAAHEILMIAQKMEQSFEILVRVGMGIIERDIQLVRAHINHLTSDISGAYTQVQSFMARVKREEEAAEAEALKAALAEEIEKNTAGQ